MAEVERERAELARHWQLRRERAGYEAERAARQYQACEPENRLVGRELERRWEEALKSQRQLEDEYERWQRTAPGRLSPDDERAIRSLAADLPAVWRAATTTPAERQRIARLLIEQVSVTVDKASERVDVELHWVGGLVESHTLSRPVRRYDLQADYPRLVARLRALVRRAAERRGDRRAAQRRGLPAAEAGRPVQPGDGAAAPVAPGPGPPRAARQPRRAWAATSTARAAWRGGWGSSRDTVRRWLRAGWLTSRRDAEGHHVIWADASELRRLRELHRPAADLGDQGPPGRIDEAEAPPGAVELSVARLTPSRATPPRSWRALWLEHRGDVLEGQGGDEVGGGADEGGGLCGVRFGLA